VPGRSYVTGVILVKLLAGAAVFGCAAALVRAGDGGADVASTLAPGGRLRAAINFGNPVLAQRGPSGEPQGVSADLARELARRLGVAVAFVPFDGAGKVTDALASDAWDVAFLARDPKRAQSIAFTPPYVIIEGTYLVRNDAPFRAIDDIDRDGVRVVVARGSAYELYLSRALQHARLQNYGSGVEALEAFAAGQGDAAGGVTQALAAFARSHAGFRLIPGRFMVIEQAVAVPASHASPAASAYLRRFVEEMKRSGFVAERLAASGQTDATVAPPSTEAP
jgi:polar amino acid transport system substrate-binding protein